MGEYLEKLCIFICVSELLGNFLPSEKFAKWYRCLSGIFVLLLLIKPLGEGVEMVFDKKSVYDVQSPEDFKELEDEYLEQLEEEEIKEYLGAYGYVEE